MLKPRREIMKKNMLIVFSFLLILNCGSSSDEIEIIYEDGVEVVLNHLDPYKIKGEPSTFTLEEEFILDFEREDLAELGIGIVRGYDIDNEGNIYILSGFKIFKFNPTGAFIKKFGERGQGPGEYTRVGRGRVLDSGELVLYDGGNKKFLFYDREGAFLREIKNEARIQVFSGSSAVYLNEHHFLFEEMNLDLEQDKLSYHLAVFDSEFEKVTDLKEWAYKENPFKVNRYNLFDAFIKYAIVRNKIYAANQANEDFEINIYDFQGNNLKRIRKEYKKVKIPEEFKQKALDSYKNSEIAELIKSKGYFPENFPPVKELYVDSSGRIYVESYEEGNDPTEVMIYIFSAEGVFIGTKSLKEALSRRFKNELLYAGYQKESGFQELVVYKMLWNIN